MDVFTALSDPTRRSILEMLASAGHLSASDIYDRFPVSHPAISQHLKALREAGLVQVEKKAQFRYYRINPQPIQELGVWVQKMTERWEEQFSVLDALLQEEQAKTNRDGMERGEGNEQD